MKQLELFTAANSKLKPQNQYEAIVYFLAHMDIEMVSAFLDEEKTYQDFPKYIFISKLISAMEIFQQAGDKVLSIHSGKCSGCSRGCGGFTFLGKQGHYLDILFLLDGTKIKDMYECSSFDNLEIIQNKIRQVFLDPVNLLFPDKDINIPDDLNEDAEDDDEGEEDGDLGNDYDELN